MMRFSPPKKSFGERIFDTIKWHFSNEFPYSAKQKKKEFYCRAGDALVKFYIEAKVILFGHTTLSNKFSCHAVEVDGIPLDEQTKCNASSEIWVRHIPSKKEQEDVLKEVVGKLNLSTVLVPVSDHYAQGHLRLLAIRRHSTKTRSPTR